MPAHIPVAYQIRRPRQIPSRLEVRAARGIAVKKTYEEPSESRIEIWSIEIWLGKYYCIKIQISNFCFAGNAVQ